MGQPKTCYIYRFVALGTMEEAIYKRQVAKISMSKRVVDDQQIGRQFKRNDLDELYSIKNIEPTNNEDRNEKPYDSILSDLLLKFKNIIYKYHSHDSLLEDKGEENLSAEERKLAWHEYENDGPQGIRSKNSIRFPCLQIGNIFTYNTAYVLIFQ